MYIQGKILDDLIIKTYKELLKLPFDIYSKRSEEHGPSSEIFGALIELENPRARMSRSDTRGKVFSALGELLWYLAESDDLAFITYYIHDYTKESVDGKTIYGAYGPRWFNSGGKHNQVQNVINLLRKSSSSRKAVIQIFESRDLDPLSPDNRETIPCTCTLQFAVRNNRLHMVVFMRSNDAYLGLPHDIFAFTMLQEIIASALNVEMGIYKHSVGSLHLYQDSISKAKQYIDEGYQSTKAFMPQMPAGDPFPAIKELLTIEKNIRTGQPYNITGSNLDTYWRDLAYLLEIFHYSKAKDSEKIKEIKKKVTNSIYHSYIDEKIVSSCPIL